MKYGMLNNMLTGIHYEKIGTEKANSTEDETAGQPANLQQADEALQTVKGLFAQQHGSKPSLCNLSDRKNIIQKKQFT